ncbi:MAG TPA: DUF6318 family protein [Cellulomonas sp.]
MPWRTTKTPAALATAAALLTLTALGAACSDPSEPPQAASTSPSTSVMAPTSSPEPSAGPLAIPTPSSPWPPRIALPSPPPEMSREDEAGAVAAAKYFLELYTYTESTQDTGPWIAMSHPSCIYCVSVRDDVAAQLNARQVTLSAPMTVTSLTAQELNPLAYSISVRVRKQPEELWTSEGALIARGSDVGGGLRLVLVRHPGKWLVRELSTFDPVTR